MTQLANDITRFVHQRSLGLLIIRLVLGLLFLMHGWAKVNAIQMTVAMFIHFGFFPWVAYFIAWLEVIGGLALILGVATRVFAFLFFVEMLVATVLVGFGHGLGIEFTLTLLSLGLMFAGSGRYSVYKMECNNCGGIFCNGNTCVVTT